MFMTLLTKKRHAIGTHGKSELPGSNGRSVSSDNGTSPPFSEELFTKLLCLERKRAERSRKPFALMLIDASKVLPTDRRHIVLERLLDALSVSTRETDICGWYKEHSVIGLILTEIGSAYTNAVRTTMLAKVNTALRTNLGPSQVEDIHISFHVFP